MRLLTKVLQLLHTLRHLRPVQIYGRLWFRLYRPRLDFKSTPNPRYRTAFWTPPAMRKVSLIGPDEWSFLNVTGSLTAVGWEGSQREKLWRFNQHYFDDLNAATAEERIDWHEALLRDWIKNNPPGVGVGWESYPTSLRIVNWLKWALNGNELPVECVDSIAIQTRWLLKRLEIHLLGNHLFANAKALVFAGVFFEGNEAERWRRKGLSILSREVPEQILRDGGHFERSPMYHLIILEDLLDLVNLHTAYGLLAPAKWSDPIQRMLWWSRLMRHPDDGIPFFNDAAFDITPPPMEVDAYAQRLGYSVDWPLGDGAYHLIQSGYARLQYDTAVLFTDLAPVGPDYLPAHAHADTLSFELSVGARRIIVNGGTSVYGNSNERHRQRSTAAHSTVVINGENSTDVWGGFRVARRARVLSANAGEGKSSLWAEGSHDGYCRLQGAPVHTRHWELALGRLTVVDQVAGDGTPHIEIIFPLAINLRPVESGSGAIKLIDDANGSSRIAVEVSGAGSIHLERTTWHPRFGESQPTWRIRILITDRLPVQHETQFQWIEL